MPGMIDTHRHMWQTAMRGYGADWTLTQYFVYYYLAWGKIFRPEDVYAGNLLSAIEAIDAGVTTSVDWSHGLRTTDHAEAAVDALEEVPGRFVLAYGNIFQGAWEWATTPEFRDFYRRRFDGKGDMLGFQIAFDLPGIEGFPEKAAFDVARDLGVEVTTHAGVYNVTGDAGINQMYDGGYMTPGTIYVHAATLSPDSYHKIAATGGYTSISTESECNAGQGYSPTWKLRKYGIPVSLSNDTSVWWSGDIFAAMRATLNADRAMEHFEAHDKGVGLTNHILRAEDVVDYGTRGGAKALGLDSAIGSVEVGKKADLVLIKNDNSPVSFPVLHPYGHVVYQAGRGDVHTVPGERQGREVRPQARRRRPGQGQGVDRVHYRVPQGRARTGGVGRRACTRRSRSTRPSTTPTPTATTSRPGRNPSNPRLAGRVRRGSPGWC